MCWNCSSLHISVSIDVNYNIYDANYSKKKHTIHICYVSPKLIQWQIFKYLKWMLCFTCVNIVMTLPKYFCHMTSYRLLMLKHNLCCICVREQKLKENTPVLPLVHGSKRKESAFISECGIIDENVHSTKWNSRNFDWIGHTLVWERTENKWYGSFHHHGYSFFMECRIYVWFIIQMCHTNARSKIIISPPNG